MVNGKADPSIGDIDGDPPLIIAARQGGPLIVAALLDNGSGHQLNVSILLTVFYNQESFLKSIFYTIKVCVSSF